MSLLASPGAASIATPSSASRPSASQTPLTREWLLLAAVGVAAALMHQAFRWPLHLPGHHGLEWLAFLMGARVLSNRPGAALAVATGAAVATVVGSLGHGPDAWLRPLIYLAQGALLDGLWTLLRGRASAAWLALPIGAAVHATSPLLKALLLWPGAAVPSVLVDGLGLPLASHAAYGAVGALVGALAAGAWLRRSRQR